MTTQIDWCVNATLPRAIFTHCGTGIVAHARDIERRVAALGQTRGVETQIAYDGLQVTLC